uniref:Uncharacterized protein n=1 Tax=Glossina morsitans morsitans TaxID=37546 RepID=A0A1B0FB03_GLOMM
MGGHASKKKKYLAESSRRRDDARNRKTPIIAPVAITRIVPDRDKCRQIHGCPPRAKPLFISTSAGGCNAT